MQFLMSASDTVFYVYDVCYMKFIAIYMLWKNTEK